MTGLPSLVRGELVHSVHKKHDLPHFLNKVYKDPAVRTNIVSESARVATIRVRAAGEHLIRV